MLKKVIYYKPESDTKVSLPCFIESTKNGCTFVTGCEVLSEEYADYIPASILIPSELNPYISSQCCICGDKILPDFHCRFDGKKAFLVRDIEEYDDFGNEIVETVVCPVVAE